MARAECCLTPRSSGAPTAGHASHQALGLRPILRLLSGASCRCRPLSSNVRPHRPMRRIFTRRDRDPFAEPAADKLLRWDGLGQTVALVVMWLAVLMLLVAGAATGSTSLAGVGPEVSYSSSGWTFVLVVLANSAMVLSLGALLLRLLQWRLRRKGRAQSP